MTRSFVLACFVLSAVLLANTQESPAPTAASISGMVTKEPGSQPIKKATIEVVAEDQGKGSNYTATTDSDGHFSIEKVEPGRYRLFVEKTGFVEINARGRKSESRFLSVREGEQLKDLLIRMLPTAVITGRIVDEDGEPMSGVLVMAQKKKAGKASNLETAGAERTNDLGEYRFHSLFPGQYLVVAMPPPDFRDYERHHDQSLEEASKPATRYLTTYYPGTFDSAKASPITLRSGDEMPLNLTLFPARTYRVRGIVTGIPAGQKAEVELTGKAGQSLLLASEVGPDGQFEVRGVGPGSYVAKATVGMDAQTLTARQEVVVVAGDVDGIKLVPVRSFTVSGHLHVEGRPGGEITQYTANLHSIDALEDSGLFVSPDSFGANVTVDRLGNFQWTNVNPGTYFVQLYGGEDRDSFLKSVTLGGRSMDTGFTVSGPAALLDLLVSPKGGTVEGVVLDHDQPVANATIVAVPEDKYRKIPSRFGAATSDQNGHFTIRGMAPGSYTAFAWQDIGNDLYYDADFLKSQESNATPLKMEEGSHEKIELKLSPIAEEWQ
jgi:hypothetical protein